ncbi:hypothetical protein PMZ80_003635 [Knufia obscura]|uniref:aldehyde dehydrogenase (NAD(+)) n=1 Tax=Knufia obscura TaxID=1635080 RepID=A0ABR0RUS5_9EURO|nr:hypothetical protein PMZ80_003635 [Knufia obscura]
MAIFQDRHAFINGSPQPSSNTNTKVIEAIDPSTLEPIAKIHTSSPSTLDAAISAGTTAFPPAASIIRSRTQHLAIIETQSTGKPYSETSTVDIATGADVLEYYANLIASGGLNGESFPLRPEAWVYTTKAPLGVCVGIGAWNYPIQIALWKSAPCLAAGNCMVYKPSEFTSLHAEELAKIYKEAGLPDGVFNVVYGGGDVGAYLTRHPDVAKVSFTGQVSTGRKVAGAAAGEMKYVTMELGGKSPVVVLPDADVESAVDGAMMANFFSTGQVCTNGTRVFVPRAMKGAFERCLVGKMEYVRAGDLFAESTNYGPLVSRVHYDKVVGYIRHGIEGDKAKLLYGGLDVEVLTKGLPEKVRKGLWVRPTVFTDCTDDMKIVKEEIFGPVMSILFYDTLEEAVRRANDTPMGLAAGVFGKDINQCHDVVRQLEAGITWVNTWGESPAEMSVGGWKQSGVGVENGRKGLEAWVKNKSTLVEMGGSVPTVYAKL